jgi:hypothetical protein
MQSFSEYNLSKSLKNWFEIGLRWFTKMSRLRDKYCSFYLHWCDGRGLNGEALTERSEVTDQRELSEANPSGVTIRD